MEENGRVITRFKVHVYDDGWHLPHEVVEEIEYRIVTARSEAVKEVKRAHDQHKGEWLTLEVAKKYATRAGLYRRIGILQYAGKIRSLGEELQELYGVTELEATNILFDHNIGDYVNKYYRIKNLIPVYVNPQFICDEVVFTYLEAVAY